MSLVRSLRFLALAVVILLGLPGTALGHSELESSTIQDGDELVAPYDDPIVLTFSAELAEGSGAKLIRTTEFRNSEGTIEPAGGEIAGAEVDGTEATMTFPRIVFGGPAGFRIEWTSISTDGDVLRGTIDFTVTRAAPMPESTPESTPEPSETAAPSPEPTSSESLVPATAPSAPPSPDPAASGSDVLVPIVVALLVVAAGGAYLLTRRRPTIR